MRATGTDDIHWLVEHTLINDAADKGGRAFSQPWGTEVVVDYVLEPGSPVEVAGIEVVYRLSADATAAALNDLGMTLWSLEEETDIFNCALDALIEVLGVRRAAIALLDDDDE